MLKAMKEGSSAKDDVKEYMKKRGLEAWHGQLQWYAVALTVICVVLWAIQAPQDINLQVEGHALSALHAPQWFRSMIGVKVNTRLVENAKRQRNSMADIYEDK